MAKSKFIYLPAGILTLATALSVAGLTSLNVDAATDTATASVTVSNACSMQGENYTYTDTITAGNYKTTEADDDKPSLVATCNDANGFSIYAVGYSPATAGGTAAEGNTGLIGTGGTIATANYSANPSSSYWAMKMTVKSDTVSAGSSVTNNFSSYSAVPASYAEVVRVGGATAGSSTASMRSDYYIYMASNQPAGTYTGGVRYVMTHPGGTAPSTGE